MPDVRACLLYRMMCRKKFPCFLDRLRPCKLWLSAFVVSPFCPAGIAYLPYRSASMSFLVAACFTFDFADQAVQQIQRFVHFHAHFTLSHTSALPSASIDVYVLCPLAS
ncbi:TPA: hypothetical protein ACHIU4_004689 [Pseudomonas aeruginosa]